MKCPPEEILDCEVKIEHDQPDDVLPELLGSGVRVVGIVGKEITIQELPAFFDASGSGCCLFAAGRDANLVIVLRHSSHLYVGTANCLGVKLDRPLVPG